MDNTNNLFLALGWQGGTIAQLQQETGLSAFGILNLDQVKALDFDERRLSCKGFDSILLQHRPHAIANIYPKYSGSIVFWAGVSQGVQYLLDNGDYNGSLDPSRKS